MIKWEQMNAAKPVVDTHLNKSIMQLIYIAMFCVAGVCAVSDKVKQRRAEIDKYCKAVDPNLEYRNCQSSSCIPTCSNPNPGPACTYDCRSGCFCTTPYVRHPNGNCVLVRNC